MGISVEKWVDTHSHIGAAADCGISDVINGLEEVFNKEEVDLRLVASPISGWLNMIMKDGDGSRAVDTFSPPRTPRTRRISFFSASSACSAVEVGADWRARMRCRMRETCVPGQ